MTEKIPWLTAYQNPVFGSDNNWEDTALTFLALSGGSAVINTGFAGSLRPDDTPKEWRSRMELRFPELHIVGLGDRQRSLNQYRRLSYAWAAGGVDIAFGRDATVLVTVRTTNEVWLDAFLRFVDEETTTPSPQGRVHVLVSGHRGLEFKNMGVAGLPLERDNYSDDVLRGYDRVLQDLDSPTPAGRIAIFNGPPGSGKTYLVRALLDAVDDATMVIVPANLIVQLAQPGTIPALMGLRRERGAKPMIFIVEDADACLAPRMGDNMSAVSAILNWGDGILGQLLDVRLIATTNAPRVELDRAILRPGRLSASVTVGALSEDHANRVFERLAGRPLADRRAYTLAEVYSLARAEGWEPAKNGGHGRIGFEASEADDDADDDEIPF